MGEGFALLPECGGDGLVFGLGRDGGEAEGAAHFLKAGGAVVFAGFCVG